MKKTRPKKKKNHFVLFFNLLLVAISPCTMSDPLAEYTKVKDFCPSCPYCENIFLNQRLLAHHFLTRHIFQQNNGATCPRCKTPEAHVLKHMTSQHNNFCLYCADVDLFGTHKTCLKLVRFAIRNYFKTQVEMLFHLANHGQNV